MLKLKTLLDLRDTINTNIKVLETLTEDYLNLVDDDLFTVDMSAEPSFVGELFCGELMLSFTTRYELKQKYLLRFCDDFGLVMYDVVKTDNGYEYLFKCGEY